MLSGDAQQSLALSKDSFTLTQEERELNAETIALIEETKELLEEFNRAKAGKTSNDIQNTEALPASHAIYFALNSAQIETDSTDLKEIVNELNMEKKLHVEIVGHADDLGNSDYNLKLSINRALSVKEYLLQQGISEERIITYGKGETAPAVPGDSEESRKLNRRVSIAFLRL
jgi:outer membrane protein OmpA-like peptidoglycan-associated protein